MNILIKALKFGPLLMIWPILFIFGRINVQIPFDICFGICLTGVLIHGILAMWANEQET